MDKYYRKYLKYRNKYRKLKGGMNQAENINTIYNLRTYILEKINDNMSDKDYEDIIKELINKFTGKNIDNTKQLNLDEIKNSISITNDEESKNKIIEMIRELQGNSPDLFKLSRKLGYIKLV